MDILLELSWKGVIQYGVELGSILNYVDQLSKQKRSCVESAIHS